MRPSARRGTSSTELLRQVRASVVEVLRRPASNMAGHQAFKSDQRLLALWAADCAEHVLPYFEEARPGDGRPREAIEACQTWARTGVFRMACVRRASLSAHAAAREARDSGHDAACFAARAAGHAVGTAHVATHSLGAALYAIKAAAASSLTDGEGSVSKERAWQLRRLRAFSAGRVQGPSSPSNAVSAEAGHATHPVW